MKTQYYDPQKKALGFEKLRRIPIKIERNDSVVLPKPDWVRIKLRANINVSKMKKLLRENKMITVCEEASCPNLSECFAKGTATFMIMGEKCTRRCSFCDVAHGRPSPLDDKEPQNLAKTVQALGLDYVVITSVDRDDLRDGGARHFSTCILQTRLINPNILIEILVPDFRGRMEKALNSLSNALPDIFNHNIETVPRLYKRARPGSDYVWSLTLLKRFKERFPSVPTKSGIMLGLGETDDEIRGVLLDLRNHDVEMLTLGQYLQPTRYHFPVSHYVTPQAFQDWADYAKAIGFRCVASGPLVRSSYHADQQHRRFVTGR